MTTRTVSRLLSITLMSLSFGVLTPSATQAATRISGRQSIKIVHEVSPWPSADERQRIQNWLSEARQNSDNLQVNLAQDSHRLTITISSSQANVSAWLQNWFKEQQTVVMGDASQTFGADHISYDIKNTTSGVQITVISDNLHFVTDLYQRLLLS